jgi:hypothetical protein
MFGTRRREITGDGDTTARGKAQQPAMPVIASH